LLKSTNPVSLAVDSSGIKVQNGRDWIRKVWKVKKGYLKIHFAVNTKKQIVSMHVTSKKVHDGKVLRRLVIGAMKSMRVRRVLVNSAYDSRKNFNFLSHGVHLGWMVSWSRKRLDLGLEARCIALVLGELLRAFSLL